jgi:hypothetical protein
MTSADDGSVEQYFAACGATALQAVQRPVIEQLTLRSVTEPWRPFCSQVKAKLHPCLAHRGASTERPEGCMMSAA